MQIIFLVPCIYYCMYIIHNVPWLAAGSLCNAVQSHGEGKPSREIKCQIIETKNTGNKITYINFWSYVRKYYKFVDQVSTHFNHPVESWVLTPRQEMGTRESSPEFKRESAKPEIIAIKQRVGWMGKVTYYTHHFKSVFRQVGLPSPCPLPPPYNALTIGLTPSRCAGGALKKFL